MANQFLSSPVLSGTPLPKQHHGRLLALLIISLLAAILIGAWLWWSAMQVVAPTPVVNNTPQARDPVAILNSRASNTSALSAADSQKIVSQLNNRTKKPTLQSQKNNPEIISTLNARSN